MKGATIVGFVMFIDMLYVSSQYSVSFRLKEKELSMKNEYRQRTCEQVVNSVEVNQSEFIKNTVERKNPIVQQKINQMSKQGGTDPEPAHLTSQLLCQM